MIAAPITVERKGLFTIHLKRNEMSLCHCIGHKEIASSLYDLGMPELFVYSMMQVSRKCMLLLTGSASRHDEIASFKELAVK